MPNLDIASLNSWYDEADAANRELFAEQRSNILLTAGVHYSANVQRNLERISAASNLTEAQKLRLTKNHVQRVVRHYKGSILSYAGGVAISPQQENELQDQKAAEQNQAVWDDAKTKYRLKERTREWANDFTQIGEVGAIIRRDPNVGEFVGYEGATDPETGAPVLDAETGAQAADETRPVFRGGFVFETIYGYNLLQHPGSKTLRGTPVCIRKMVPKKELEARYKDDQEKLKYIQASSDDEFVVFDADKARYTKEKDQVCWREYYWPKCHEYPMGYYAMSTRSGICEEGPLPEGIWPIAFALFDQSPSAPRGRSIVKVIRPWQAEINRASSQQAQHQITVGDDKIVYQAGTKLQSGALLPGVRGITYQGMQPQILAGRDGSQFGAYIDQQVRDLYAAVDLEHLFDEKPTGAIEPYTLLYRSAKDQLKFSEYHEKFEQFLIDLCSIYLEMARFYLEDDELIYIMGRKEQVNIDEFRSTTPLQYRIKMEAQAETIESKLGKQLTINHTLQYVGNKLEKEDIGKLMRSMPYGNFEESFSDFTIDYDNAQNIMLSIERGQQPAFSQFDNHEYIVKRLGKRVREADFPYLDDRIKQLYQLVYVQHRDAYTKQVEAEMRAKDEMIPIGGAMIGCDMYVPDKKNPDNAPKRVRVPYQALDWLINTLEQQGMTMEKLEMQNQQTIAEMADQIFPQQPPPQQPGAPRQLMRA